MQRIITLAGLLLAGLLAGCTTDVDMANMRDNALHSTQIQADQVTTIEARLARLEATEADRQRSLLRLNAALDALRGQQRALRGEFEELQYGQERSGSDIELRMAALEQRLRSLETQIGPGGMVQDLDSEIDDALPPGEGAGTQPRPVVVPPQAPESQGAASQEVNTALAADPPATRERLDTAAAPQNPESEQAAEVPAMSEPNEVDAVSPSRPEPRPVQTPSRDDPQAARLFQRARGSYQQGDYEVAIILFKQYLRQYPRASQAGDAQYWIGESLYAQKEFNAAIVAFDEVIQEYPQSDRVASSTLKVGLSFANLEDQPNARFFLQQVQENFPNSSEAQLATEKLKQLRR